MATLKDRTRPRMVRHPACESVPQSPCVMRKSVPQSPCGSSSSSAGFYSGSCAAPSVACERWRSPSAKAEVERRSLQLGRQHHVSPDLLHLLEVCYSSRSAISRNCTAQRLAVQQYIRQRSGRWRARPSRASPSRAQLFPSARRVCDRCRCRRDTPKCGPFCRAVRWIGGAPESGQRSATLQLLFGEASGPLEGAAAVATASWRGEGDVRLLSIAAMSAIEVTPAAAQ